MRMIQKSYPQLFVCRPCLLLREKHRPNVIKSFCEPFPKFSQICPSFSSRILKNEKVETILDHQKEEGGEDPLFFVQEEDGYIVVSFKDVNDNISYWDISVKIINESKEEQAFTNPENSIRNILLCTKATDAVTAVQSILHMIHPTKKIKIIIMTNGSMGVVLNIHKLLKEHGLQDQVDIILASTTNGVHRGDEHDYDFRTMNQKMNNRSFNVHHAGLGQTFIEDTNEISTTLSTIWNKAGLGTHLISSEEMIVLNWKKLAANCAINPLTALRKCQNGDLLKAPSSIVGASYSNDLKQRHSQRLHYNEPMIFYKLVREVSDVALAESQKYSLHDRSLFQEQFKYESLVSFVEGVVRDTSKNKSSMLQDILQNRYPTEIDYLNGYVSRLGLEHGLNVKANHYICNEIENLTSHELKYEK